MSEGIPNTPNTPGGDAGLPPEAMPSSADASSEIPDIAHDTYEFPPADAISGSNEPSPAPVQPEAASQPRVERVSWPPIVEQAGSDPQQQEVLQARRNYTEQVFYGDANQSTNGTEGLLNQARSALAQKEGTYAGDLFAQLPEAQQKFVLGKIDQAATSQKGFDFMFKEAKSKKDLQAMQFVGFALLQNGFEGKQQKPLESLSEEQRRVVEVGQTISMEASRRLAEMAMASGELPPGRLSKMYRTFQTLSTHEALPGGYNRFAETANRAFEKLPDEWKQKVSAFQEKKPAKPKPKTEIPTAAEVLEDKVIEGEFKPKVDTPKPETTELIRREKEAEPQQKVEKVSVEQPRTPEKDEVIDVTYNPETKSYDPIDTVKPEVIDRETDEVKPWVGEAGEKLLELGAEAGLWTDKNEVQFLKSLETQVQYTDWVRYIGEQPWLMRQMLRIGNTPNWVHARWEAMGALGFVPFGKELGLRRDSGLTELREKVLTKMEVLQENIPVANRTQFEAIINSLAIGTQLEQRRTEGWKTAQKAAVATGKFGARTGWQATKIGAKATVGTGRLAFQGVSNFTRGFARGFVEGTRFLFTPRAWTKEKIKQWRERRTEEKSQEFLADVDEWITENPGAHFEDWQASASKKERERFDQEVRTRNLQPSVLWEARRRGIQRNQAA